MFCQKFPKITFKAGLSTFFCAKELFGSLVYMGLTSNIQQTIPSNFGQERQADTRFNHHEPEAHGKDSLS